MQLNITTADCRLQKAIMGNERAVKMCTLAEASDLVEFEKSTHQHARAMCEIVTWAESGYIPTCNDLLDLHAQLFAHGGVYRSCNIRISQSACVPPHYMHVPYLMRNWRENMVWLLTHESDPYLALAYIHLEATRIHPMSDGNGRLFRMVLQHNAVYRNLPFILIKQEHRNAYLDLLENEDATGLAQFFRSLTY